MTSYSLFRCPPDHLNPLKASPAPDHHQIFSFLPANLPFCHIIPVVTDLKNSHAHAYMLQEVRPSPHLISRLSRYCM